MFTEETQAWDVTVADDISVARLAGVTAASPPILVVGCGARFLTPPKGLRAALKAQGIVLEWMDTGAACRTFNVLLTEDRGAVGAFIAVD